MRSIEFDELIPEPTEFSLCKNPERKYQLRAFSIADESWAKSKYGDLGDRIRRMDMAFMCALTIRLMADEDKADFAAKEVKTFDESTGEWGKIRLGGGPLLEAMLHGNRDKQTILNAITRSIGVSQPLQDQLAQIVSEGVKKNLAGPRSSTSSPVNTAGSPSESSSSPPGSSSA